MIFDPADRALQSFFRGKLPDAEDLVNAHHTLARLADQPQGATLSELLAISPLPKTRLRVCLSMLERFRLVDRGKGRRYRPVRGALLRSEAERLASKFRERGERARLKQQQMVEYAGSRSCRWAGLLDYFGREETLDSACGHCDRCSGACAS